MIEDAQMIVDAVVSAWGSAQAAEGLPGWCAVRCELSTSRSLTRFLDWQARQPIAFFAHPETGEQMLGLGAAQVIAGDGADVEGETHRQLREMSIAADLRWFGGFAFDPTTSLTGIWSGWPQAIWFLPKLTLVREADTAEVRLIYLDHVGQSPSEVKRALCALFATDASDAVSHTAGGTAVADAMENGLVHDLSAWQTYLEQSLKEIDDGRLAKVVIARQQPQRVETTLMETMDRLISGYRDSHAFAMHWHKLWFLGASPEQLVRAESGTLAVDCLAGSMARGRTLHEDEALAAALFASEKNRNEHQAVVQFVTDRLKLISQEIEWPDVPTVKRLANVQHLFTPVRAKLNDGKHILDAVSLLHPTPAVGGVPRADALSFIRTHEGWERGYYAGAFGFMDGAGDGVLTVTLRSAAVRYPTAMLFAGCGIVAGSNVDEEWKETQMKLLPMRMAFQQGGDTNVQ